MNGDHYGLAVQTPYKGKIIWEDLIAYVAKQNASSRLV